MVVFFICRSYSKYLERQSAQESKTAKYLLNGHTKIICPSSLIVGRLLETNLAPKPAVCRINLANGLIFRIDVCIKKSRLHIRIMYLKSE